MGNCLVTKLKENVNNDNLTKIGELSFNCKVLRECEVTIGGQYSLLSFSGNYSVDIISDTTTLSDGTKHYEGNGSCTLVLSTIGEVFTLKVRSKYDITNIYLNYGPGPTYTAALQVSDSYLGKFKYSYNATIIRGVRIDDIKDYFYFSSNGNYYFPNIIDDTNPGSIRYIKGTLKQMIDARTINGRLYNAAETRDEFIMYNNVVTEKDLSQYPANVSYINVTRNCTWTPGVRNTSDYFILCAGGNNDSGFATANDLDNYFIDNAKCTLGTINTTMTWKCAQQYTPSAEAVTAIATLKEKGVTEIKVNNVIL